MSPVPELVESITVKGFCPRCNGDNIDFDPPYAACNDCGWQGRA